MLGSQIDYLAERSRVIAIDLGEHGESGLGRIATAPTDIASLRRHGVEPILLEDVGHFPMIEAPDRFNAVLAATLASFGS